MEVGSDTTAIVLERRRADASGYRGRRDVRTLGGPGRDRTDDLFHAMEARSQLRHRPTCGDTTGLIGNDLDYSR
jgi:hypothetical protein